MYFLIQIKTG